MKNDNATVLAQIFATLSLTALLFISGCEQAKETPTHDKPMTNNVVDKPSPTLGMPLVATGGTPADFAVCPQSIYDTIVPIDEVNPPAKDNEPEMTVSGLAAFIEKHNITTIEELASHFPDHYKNNFSLVEITRATGESNLQFPRIVVFGSDGHFLLNIGTKPDDPKYNLLDVAELHEDTGHWEFSVFDFNGEKPVLTRNDPSCIECHGDKNSRPVWGTNLLWTGVFGDNVAKGPQGEALDGRHVKRMTEIMAGEGGSPRFDFLVWRDEPLKRGGKRKIANHVLGVDLFLSNIAMGSATARGAYIRLKQTFPEDYKALRHALLFAYYLKRGNAFIDKALEPEITLILEKYKIDEFTLGNILLALGIDENEAFSVATLHEKETPDPVWKMGRGDLHDMLILQILDELKNENADVNKILSNRQVEEEIFGCPDTANNIAEVVDFKMLHLFHLQGHSRYLVNQHFYPLDAEDIYNRVLLPISHDFMLYLKENLQTQIPLG